MIHLYTSKALCYINTCLASFKAWISFHFPSNISYNDYDNDNDLLFSFFYKSKGTSKLTPVFNAH